eukprot:gene3959-4319_t
MHHQPHNNPPPLRRVVIPKKGLHGLITPHHVRTQAAAEARKKSAAPHGAVPTASSRRRLAHAAPSRQAATCPCPERVQKRRLHHTLANVQTLLTAYDS